MRNRSQIYLVNENEDYLWLVNERRERVEDVNDFFLMYYYIIRLNHIKAIHVANNSK